jgi:hypothetical protein
MWQNGRFLGHIFDGSGDYTVLWVAALVILALAGLFGLAFSFQGSVQL